MVVCAKTDTLRQACNCLRRLFLGRWSAIISLISIASLTIPQALGQAPTLNWQAQVRKYAEAKDWDSAMRVVEQQIALAPQDMDVRAWRARVLAWSGRLPEAEKEYREILKVSGADPDNWLGLANVCLREEKLPEALQAINAAEDLDPKRPDIHAARARILRAAGKTNEAKLEFQSALRLDPASLEAHEGLVSVRRGAQHELRFGQDNDLFNYSAGFHDEWVSLASHWTSHWATSVAADIYQRSGAEAGKFVGSVTRRQPWGVIAAGGAIGHDNAVIPKSEAFFDFDHGWRTGERSFIRGVEIDYAQHWYWYQAARILSLSGSSLIYLPQDWTFTLAGAGARSAFSGTGVEWKPSGLSRLAFPLAHWSDRRLSGNIFFAAGTENFAIVDQIGSFASQTYGGGLRFQLSDRQDITGNAGYQSRTQNRTDLSFGLRYGIHF